jgi:hypothetical protein
MSNGWKQWKRGFPYKNGINNPQYKKDRNALFEKHGNGWWCNDGKGWEMNPETSMAYQRRRRKYNERK